MQGLKKTLFTPVAIVFAVVMAVVLIAFLMAQNSVEREIDRSVETYIKENEDAIKDRLSIFEETLRAGVGLFAGSPNLTPDQWAKFIATSAVIERYPGAQNVVYTRQVAQKDVGTFTEYARNAITPAFTISPAGNRESYAPLLFVAPSHSSNTAMLGADLYAEASQREAFIDAQERGEAVLSAVGWPFTQAGEENKAFMMIMPQYRSGLPIETIEQRQIAIEGYLSIVFRVDAFMQHITTQQDQNDVSFSMWLADADESLFETKEFKEITSDEHVTRTSKLDFDGTSINITYAYDRNATLPAYMASRPMAILVFGSATALLIAIAVLLVLRGKANELLLEQERGINEAKDNLLSLASHQLRTPATGVKQYIGLILQGFAGDITPQQRGLLEKAYAGNERQLKTINDVLYLARLESGRIVLSKSEFSPAKLVTDLVNELTSDAREKQHRISVKIPKRQRTVFGDEHMIRMAVENLLTNAIKYTHKKGKITVQLIYGRELKIIVRDNGLGIPLDQQHRMFNQFERIDNELSVSVGGSGIGLYVVQNIIELHGGHIEVDSEVGKGSEFRVNLPYGNRNENAKV